MRPLTLGLLTLILNTLVATSVWGDEPATAIIRKGETQIRGLNSQTLMTMKIIRPDFTRQLKLRSWSLGSNKAMVEILQPAKEEGVSSLRVGSQMWNYLPNVDQVVRVPISLMLQSWMGSDFTNDDLMKASSILRDYHHRILKTEVVDREKVVLIECTAKHGAAVVWGKILYWARLSDKLPLRQKFFDEGGKLVRVVKFSQFRRMDDRVIPTVVAIVPAGETHSMTVVRYQRVLYDRKVPDSFFNREHLRRTSQEGRELATMWFKQPVPGLAKKKMVVTMLH